MKYGILFSLGLLVVGSTVLASTKGRLSLSSAKPISTKPVSSIVPINSIKDAKLTNADKNSLVVFDIVDTLILSDPSDYNPRLKPAANPEFQKVKEDLEDIALSKFMLNLKRTLVEKKFQEIIKILQYFSIKTIALSSYLVGSYGAINNLQEWRYNQLNKLDINLSGSFNIQTLVLNNFATYRGTKPTYYKGILFTNNYSKGEVLSEFLVQMKLKPSIVICIDDNLDYLESLKAAMAKKEIPFQGYHYLHAQKKVSA